MKLRPITAEQRERLGDRTVIASVSTGKDSVALSLWLKENGIEHERVFMDTRWEQAAVMRHLEHLRDKLGPIVSLSGPLGMVDLIRKKGMFPSRARRFCTEELKTFPVQAYLNARMDAGEDIVNAVGIRHDESPERAKMPEWEWMDDFDCEVWRPLIHWSLAEVIAIHKRHGVNPNPLYLMGMERVGCWPCINSNKGEIRKIAELDPARIDEIRELEAEIGIKARARYDLRLAKFTAGGAAALTIREKKLLLDNDGNVKPFSPPHFFQSPLKEEGGKCWPIDRVVAWSRTKFGGRIEERQADLLAFGGINDGCMRWGMCETAPTDPDAPIPNWVETEEDLDDLKAAINYRDEESLASLLIATSEGMSDLARAKGFDDGPEMLRLIAQLDLSVLANMQAFRVWKDEDGTKAGLMTLLQRE